MTTADIQHLREQTGVGMMDAKRALEAAGGDMVAAVEHLRKAGQKIAASKSSRAAKEGTVGVWIAEDRRRAALVALACETDFVARTEDFQRVAQQLAAYLGSLNQANITAETFLEQPGFDGGATVRQSLEASIAKLGENMQIPSVAVLSAATGSIASYLHPSRKVAALIALDGGSDEVGHDLTMHIAAMNPTYLDAASVPDAVVASEQGIYREQLKREGKPEAMWDKILPGKLKKFYAEVCLIDQPFVKDDALTVGQYLKNSGGATLSGFTRVAI